MRVVALLSGGKDSLLNACHCVVNGHELVAIAHSYSKTGGELDSYMYQTAGNEAIDMLAECMNLPLYKKPICGTSLQTHLAYDQFHEGDEVEDLFQLLAQVKREKAIEAVASGAILATINVFVLNISVVDSDYNIWHFSGEKIHGVY